MQDSIPGGPRVILPEILGEIFGWISAETLLYKKGKLELVDLMLVCKLWYDVVLQTPHLWSRVRVPLLWHIDYEKVAEWLNRAGTTPQSLKIVEPCMATICPCGKLGSMICPLATSDFAPFLAYGPHLEHLTLPESPSSCFEHLLQRLSTFELGTIPLAWHSIKCLKLSFRWGYHDETTLASGSIFNSLPSALTSLELKFPPSDSQLESRFDLPPSTLKQLKSLNIECDWRIARITDLLYHCTSLQHLGIEHTSSMRCTPIRLNRTPEIPNLSHVDPISLPYLLSVDLYIPGSENPAYLLQRLSAPNLQDVHVYNEHPLSPHVVQESLSPLGIVAPGLGVQSIQSLTIHEQYSHMAAPNRISSTLLADLLSNLTDLTHICLERVTFDVKEVFTAVERLHSDTRRVAPRLRTIELVDPGDDFELEDFLRCLTLCSSRHRGFDALKRLEIRFGGCAFRYPRLLALYNSSPMIELAQSVGIVVDLYK